MRRSVKMALISLSPLILFVNLVPGIQVINIKLLLGVQFALLGCLSLRYRNELIQWNVRKVRESREATKRYHYLRILIVTALLFGMSAFILVRYLLEVFRE